LRGELAQGKQVTLANGRLIDSERVLGPPERGRKLVIVGDAETTEGFRDADLLVIEATFLERDASIARDNGHLAAAEAAELSSSSS
jgi:ribonuclease Z